MIQEVKIVGEMLFCLMPERKWAMIVSLKDKDNFNYTLIGSGEKAIKTIVPAHDVKVSLAWLLTIDNPKLRDRQNIEFWFKCLELRGKVLLTRAESNTPV